ncbi:DUF4350 domain-containing protein [Lederbergia wuyishanensis]|uniref:DUF4350 domain-containing protein n=1 Tax=Lederbergia wuyishanensis TaxID=1347903 RepID=A0ABU0D0A2_9BACI|nr:DUF4350 domain-containing protein [Lederbergia wuyishanensis]MCJ8006441.1 DUF4350 domain-containing protein [Lederbergia wuyishanensis]MDQ0341816.1 hypothetical protein [Lederbergia wuyishanensis]
MLRSISKTWIWLIILLVIFVLASFLMFSQKPKSYPNYVTDSPSPTGVKALYTYLQNNNDTVNRWKHRPDLLNKHVGNQLLVMIEPFFMPTTKEINEYIDFMNAGNTIILFSERPDGFFDLKSNFLEEDLSGKKIKIRDSHKTSLNGTVVSPVRLQTNKQDKILLEDKEGTIALKKKYGNGNLIVSITPEWLTNGNILSNNNIPLILSLLHEEKADIVFFDEYVHTGENASTIWTVYPKWFLILMLQLIVLSILWLWAKGKRFGPILVPREETVRFGDEGIKALAAWYLRGQRYYESLVIQADYIKQLLNERFGISASKEWTEISDLLIRKKIDISNMQMLKDIGPVLQKGKLNKQEYLLWSKRLDRLREEVVRR